jgi:type II secretory pathway component PulF
MLFHYTASDANGKVVEAEYEAATEKDLLGYLASHELRPLSVNEVKRGGKTSIFGGGKITLDDKVFLTRYLALMLKVDTDLLAAIGILIADFEKPAVRNFLIEVRSNLSRGQQFYQTFAKYPKYFSSVFVNLVKAAESSGRLQQAFDDLSQSLQKDSDLKKRIISAFIYPVILLVLSAAIFLFLCIFALPKIAKVFSDTGSTPPVFSRVVFAIGLFVGNNAVIILSLIAAFIVSVYVIFGKTQAGKRFGMQLLRRTPVVKNVFRDLSVQQFASTFSALIKAGLPIIETTKITGDVVSAPDFKASLYRVADEGLARGLTLGEAFKKEGVFPKVVTSLVAISEKAGHMDEVLLTLSQFYESNVDNSVHTLVAFIEPILLLLMGVMVASIALAIIIPIYQLTANF